jgi:uncharacterized membrane protein
MMDVGPKLTPERVRSFSDGMFGIIITVMVLQLKVPHSPDLSALFEQWPLFFAYALSYLQAGLYWVNHHSLFDSVEQVDSRILWLNLLLLFFLTFMPFATDYVGETAFAPVPTAIYAFVMLLPAATWDSLHRAIGRINLGEGQVTRAAQVKGWIALLLYAVAIPSAFVSPIITLTLIFVVVGMYFLPTRYF